MSNKKITLIPCPYCGEYPRLAKVYDEYKYLHCRMGCENLYGIMGNWHSTKNGARRAWNKRCGGEYA